jgi:hypothetical protein
MSRGWRYLLLVLVPAWLYVAIRIGLLSQLMSNATAAFSYTGILVLYLCSSPSRWEGAAVAASGAIMYVFSGSPAVNDFPLALIIHFTGVTGLAGVGALMARAALSRDYRPGLAMLLRVWIFAVLGVVIAYILDAAGRMRPIKFDLYLYSIERTFGLPSFAVGRWFAAHPRFASFELLIYYSLPLVLAGLYAAHLKMSQTRVDILFLLYVNALVGFGLYFLFPACGPAYIFTTDFPSFAPPINGFFPLVTDCRPNAMPSLHISGALLILWNSRPFGRVQILSLAYLVLTVLATLGFGEHYLIDLIVAVPFALFVQSVATDTRYRLPVALLGAVALLLWIGSLYYALPVLSRTSVLWSATAMTLGAAGFGMRLLNRCGPAVVLPEPLPLEAQSE